jgi:hypothetical protein
MNDYSFALFKEVAAQRAGYVPSPMWGRLVHAVKDKNKQPQYDILTTYKEPHHLATKQLTPAHQDVIDYAKHIRNNITNNSDIRKDLLQFD